MLALGWIAAQIATTGFVSWLQPAVAATCVLILWLALWLAREP